MGLCLSKSTEHHANKQTDSPLTCISEDHEAKQGAKKGPDHASVHSKQPQGRNVPLSNRGSNRFVTSQPGLGSTSDQAIGRSTVRCCEEHGDDITHATAKSSAVGHGQHGAPQDGMDTLCLAVLLASDTLLAELYSSRTPEHQPGGVQKQEQEQQELQGTQLQQALDQPAAEFVGSGCPSQCIGPATPLEPTAAASSLEVMGQRATIGTGVGGGSKPRVSLDHARLWQPKSQPAQEAWSAVQRLPSRTDHTYAVGSGTLHSGANTRGGASMTRKSLELSADLSDMPMCIRSFDDAQHLKAAAVLIASHCPAGSLPPSAVDVAIAQAAGADVVTTLTRGCSSGLAVETMHTAAAGGRYSSSGRLTPHVASHAAQPAAPFAAAQAAVVAASHALGMHHLSAGMPPGLPVAPRSEGCALGMLPEEMVSQVALPWRFRQLNRQQSLARLLNVSQYVSADIEPPATTNLIPADTFETLASDELNEMLSKGDQVCNLVAVSPHVPSTMKRTRWSLEDFTLVKHLHQGYVADVVQAVCKLSGLMVALKVYSVPDMSELNRVQLLREIRLQCAQHHPHIVALYAAFMEQGNTTVGVGKARYNHVVLVEEWAEGGDLLQAMCRAGGRLSERAAVHCVMKPLLSALEHLHMKGIVHRDIKPGNLLFAAPIPAHMNAAATLGHRPHTPNSQRFGSSSPFVVGEPLMTIQTDVPTQPVRPGSSQSPLARVASARAAPGASLFGNAGGGHGSSGALTSYTSGPKAPTSIDSSLGYIPAGLGWASPPVSSSLPGLAVATQPRMVLADFGLALDLNDERANTRAGTLAFMAPEVLACPEKARPDNHKAAPRSVDSSLARAQSPAHARAPVSSGAAAGILSQDLPQAAMAAPTPPALESDPDYSTSADTWAVGALLYAMITGEPPFKGQTTVEMACKIVSMDAHSTVTFPSRVGPLARDFILQCLRRAPAERPTIMELLHHPLLESLDGVSPGLGRRMPSGK